jgi:hypothetical protein
MPQYRDNHKAAQALAEWTLGSWTGETAFQVTKKLKISKSTLYNWKTELAKDDELGKLYVTYLQQAIGNNESMDLITARHWSLELSETITSLLQAARVKAPDASMEELAMILKEVGGLEISRTVIEAEYGNASSTSRGTQFAASDTAEQTGTAPYNAN